MELPDEREKRFITQYGLKEDDAVILTSETSLAVYFEATVTEGAEASDAAKWILGEALSMIKEEEGSMDSFPVAPDRFAGLLRSVTDGIVSVATGKSVLRKMASNDLTAAEIIEEEGLAQLSDESALSDAVAKVLEDNPDELERYRSGKKALFGFFMGAVMKATSGKSDPKVTRQLLTDALEGK